MPGHIVRFLLLFQYGKHGQQMDCNPDNSSSPSVAFKTIKKGILLDYFLGWEQEALFCNVSILTGERVSKNGAR